MGFKVGDTVRRLCDGQGGVVRGGIYTVDAADGGRVWLKGYAPEFREPYFELAEPLKAEVGATVVIGDGKDEWVIQNLRDYDPPAGWRKDTAIISRGNTAVEVQIGDITVVKAKPEPPKPDYYVNAKGRPRRGDVMINGSGVVWAFRTDTLMRAVEGGEELDITRLAPGGHSELLVRAGKPFRGE